MIYFLIGVAYTLLAATIVAIFGEQILIRKMEKELERADTVGKSKKDH